MVDPGDRDVEFESRRFQTARAEHALQLAASLKTDFMIHMGDLIQSFPESDDYDQAISEARAQLARCGLAPRLVAGNHDIGDKPDPTMPTNWVTASSLATYHAQFGQSWYSWNQKNCHFVVLNSQIMNSGLTEAGMQQKWVEADLAAHAHQPLFIFLHMPPYLYSACEPALGHYDNLDEPARGWLLDLVRQYNVEWLFAAHVHYMFYDQIGATRYVTSPSVSFTRPGFGEMFSSGPPAERGRNDVAKLGFYLIRRDTDRANLHLIRTNGNTSPAKAQSGEKQLLTRTSFELLDSPLGVSLNHPLTSVIDVPIAWPSSIRQRVRNDYPFFACMELGVRHIRVPISDLGDPLQRRQLSCLHQEGIQVTGTCLWSDRIDYHELTLPGEGMLSAIELMVPGDTLPEIEQINRLQNALEDAGISITLTILQSRKTVHGKQHDRVQLGYQYTEIDDLNQRLSQANLSMPRVVCRIGAGDSPWDVLLQHSQSPGWSNIQAIDWLVEIDSMDETEQSCRLAEALFAGSLTSGSRD